MRSEGPLERRPNVIDLEIEPAQRGQHLGAAEERCGIDGDGQVHVEVPIPDIAGVARLDEPIARVLTDGLQHRVARGIPVFDLHQRALHEPGHRVERRHQLGVIRATVRRSIGGWCLGCRRSQQRRRHPASSLR